MLRTALSLPLLALALALAACATPSDPETAEPILQLASQRGSGTVDWSETGSVQALASLTSGSLTVDIAVRFAMLNNPRFQESLAEAGIARADLMAAGILGNPTLSVKTRFPDGGNGGANVEFALAEDLLDVLMLPGRKRLAAIEYEQAQAKAADAILGFAAEVRTAWYELAGLQQLAAIEGEMSAAAESAVELSKRQVEAGTANALFEKNQEALAQEIALERMRTDASAEEARQHLNQLLGFARDGRKWLVGAGLPAPSAADPDPSELTTRALQLRLDLAAARKEAEAATEAAAIKRRWSWVPLLEVGVSTERDPGGQWVTGPSLDFALPFFNRGQADLARLEAQGRQSRARVSELEIAIPAEVRIQAGRVAFQHELVRRSQDEIVPLRNEIVDLTQQHYNFMLVDVYRLLDAKREEIKAERELMNALRDYWLAIVELERVSGGALHLPPPASGDSAPASAPKPGAMQTPMNMPMSMPM